MAQYSSLIVRMLFAWVKIGVTRYLKCSLNPSVGSNVSLAVGASVLNVLTFSNAAWDQTTSQPTTKDKTCS